MKRERGVTLMELLIAVTLLGLLSGGILISLRVGLNAMNKSDSKLMSNRRVAGVERILGEEISGIMPVTAECRGQGDAPGTRVSFFQGDAESMRLASNYSLQQGSRGMPMILEYQVIPGENGQGVRLVVNELLYSGPRGAGQLCLGVGDDQAPLFVPIQVGAGSFVLADKLAHCSFSFAEIVDNNVRWVTHWTKNLLPNAIRVEMAPLNPDWSRLQPVTLTIPVRVTRWPLETYVAR